MVLSQIKDGTNECFYHVSASAIIEKSGSKLNINNFVDACDKLQSRNLKLITKRKNLLSVQTASRAIFGRFALLHFGKLVGVADVAFCFVGRNVLAPIGGRLLWHSVGKKEHERKKCLAFKRYFNEDSEITS
jgi:hypothetical protein